MRILRKVEDGSIKEENVPNSKAFSVGKLESDTHLLALAFAIKGD